MPVAAAMLLSSWLKVTRPLTSGGGIDPAYSEREGGALAICGAQLSSRSGAGGCVACGMLGTGSGLGCGVVTCVSVAGLAVGGVVNAIFPY